MKKGAVSSAWREKGRYTVIAACIEDQPVESAVDDISQSSGHDQRKADDQARMRGLFFEPVDIYTDYDDGNDPEDAQDQFASRSSKRVPESHPFIFREVEDKPVSGHVNFLAYGHVRLDPDL